MTETVTLPDLGAACALRPARLADVYAAIELVDVPQALAARPDAARVAYQMAIDDAQIALQVLSRDGELVADVRAFLDELSPDDMAALREAAERVKKKRKPASAPSAS